MVKKAKATPKAKPSPKTPVSSSSSQKPVTPISAQGMEYYNESLAAKLSTMKMMTKLLFQRAINTGHGPLLKTLLARDVALVDLLWMFDAAHSTINGPALNVDEGSATPSSKVALQRRLMLESSPTTAPTQSKMPATAESPPPVIYLPSAPPSPAKTVVIDLDGGHRPRR